MGNMLKLGVADRLLLVFVLVLFLGVILFCSIFVSDLYLAVAFNAIFIFTIVFYLMLFLNKGNVGEAKPPKKFPSITIIIPCFNSKNTIVECIESVKRMKYGKKVNILVVDDCSTDGSREILEKIKGIELFKLKKNMGRSAAINLAIKRVRTDFLVTVDSDSYPEDDVLMKTMGYFEDSSIYSVSCLVLPDKRDNLIRKIQNLEYAIGFGLANTLLASIDSSYVVPGPFTVFRKEVFERIGYYEEGNFAEDMEFGLRMKANSMRLANCHVALVRTDIPGNLGGLFIQRNRWYRGGAFNFMRYKKLMFNSKNPNFGLFMMPFLFVSQVMIVAVLLRMLLFFLHDAYVFLSVLFDYVSLGGNLFVGDYSITASSALVFFIVSYLLISIYFYVCLSQVKYRLKLDDILPLAILILIYPYFITVTYSQSYFKEIFGVDEKWRRVST